MHTSRPIALTIAILAELVYVAGRAQLRTAFADPLVGEIGLTIWRLVFVILYALLFLPMVRESLRKLSVPLHPVIVGAAVLSIAALPLGGYGARFDATTLQVFALTTFVVALREELFYRLILLGALEKLVHPVVAILASATLFVVYHFGAQPMTLVTISSMAAAGVLFGVIYQRTRSLLLVVILHAVFDLVLLVPHAKLIAEGAVVAANIVALCAALIWWRIAAGKPVTGA